MHKAGVGDSGAEEGKLPEVGQPFEMFQAGVGILIATLGRLLDLMNQEHIDLARVKILILDEVDRMLDMDFIHDLRRPIEVEKSHALL